MTLVETRLRFEADGTVTAFSGKMEYGQGLSAAYPRIVAEELGISHTRVHVVLGDTDLTPWDMGTFGSMSVEMDGLELRRSAAFARGVLLARAAERWHCTSTDLVIDDGTIRFPKEGRTAALAELAAGVPVSGEVPEDVRLASPTPVCPDSPGALDGIALVTGRLEFAGDVRLLNMAHGAVLHPAVHGAKLRSIDADAAKAMPGVIAVVREDDFAGVVAGHHAEAVDALAALAPVWDPPPAESAEAMDIALRADDGAAAALGNAGVTIRARYFTPHVAGSPLGPSAGVADVRVDDAVVYGTTQVPFRLREQVAQLTGLAPERVHFVPRAMSGGFGRHGASDAPVEAARLSKAVGRPVSVQWARVDELRAGPNRPEMTAELEAALDRGRIAAWRSDVWTNPYAYDGAGRRESATPAAKPREAAHPGGGWGSPAQMTAMMAGRNGIPPYDIGRAAISLHVSKGKVRTGALRSLGASPNVFAIESFMDELARAAGQDPIAFRLAHLTDARLRRVLELVRERSNWDKRAVRSGLGVACVEYRRTCVAQVAKVAVAGSGRVQVERVWCAVDAGHIVHPDGARNQVEGAVQMAISWTLIERLPHREAEVTGSTWKDYPIATFHDAPGAIDIVFAGEDENPPLGLGEPPAVPMVAAIANAIFDACGARVRQLPIDQPAVLRALAERAS